MYFQVQFIYCTHCYINIKIVKQKNIKRILLSQSLLFSFLKKATFLLSGHFVIFFYNIYNLKH